VMALFSWMISCYSVSSIGSTMTIMLLNIYDMEPEYATLVALVGRGGLLLSTPIPAFVLKYKLLTRL